MALSIATPQEMLGRDVAEHWRESLEYCPEKSDYVDD